MSNLYLCVFDSEIKRSELTKFLDSKYDVAFWFYNLPNSVFIESDLQTKELSRMLETKFGHFTHIVVKVDERWGRLPKDHWQYFK